MADAVAIRGLKFGWGNKRILDVSELRVGAAEQMLITGPSGSGKTSLLNLLAGLATPSAGRIEIDGQDIVVMSQSRRDAIRAARMGVIFQMFNLAPYLSVVANVALPCRFSASRRAHAARRSGSVEKEAVRLLARLGIGNQKLLRRSASRLSVGQQQRVAVARALIGGPSLILADEPTSALDREACERFVDLLKEECADTGAALVMVSHDDRVFGLFPRIIRLSDINQTVLEAA